jgi:hypothetical protein
MHGSHYKSTKKYYPEGVLCWFPCDRYGERCGPALIVKRVPEKTFKWGDVDRGLETYKRMIEERKAPKLMSQLLSSSPASESIPEVKPSFFQYPPKNTHFYNWR